MLIRTSLVLDRKRVAQLADWAAVGVAVSLPWSTSATSILLVLWLVTLLPTLDVAMVRREVETAAGGLPVLLWLLAALGMLWADVSWADRIHGLGGFHRLLVIPLLLAQFRRSEHGAWVLYGFLASAVTLLLRVLGFGAGSSSVVAQSPSRVWRLGQGRHCAKYRFPDLCDGSHLACVAKRCVSAIG